LDKPTGGPPFPGGYGPRPTAAFDSGDSPYDPTPWQSPAPTAVFPSPTAPGGSPPPFRSEPTYAPVGPPPYPGSTYPPATPAPAPAKSGKGCLKAFLISLAVAVVLAIIAVVVLGVMTNRLVQNTIGTAKPEDFELSAEMACNFDAGRMSMTGAITNTTDHNQEFRISIEFVEGKTGPKLGEATALTGSLSAGQSTGFRASSVVSSQPTGLTCRIVDVAYNGP
jgi:hypothetical protein